MRGFVRLATVAALICVPALSMAASPSADNSAQSVTDSEIGKAGAALHDIAQLQRKYQGQIDGATSEQKKRLSDQANAEAVQSIQSHGMSVQEYSHVVQVAQTNPEVKQRLLGAARQAQ